MNAVENSEWYISRNGKQVGPISRAQLDELHQSGKLAPNDDVWSASLGDWKPASTLFTFARSAAPPPPPRRDLSTLGAADDSRAQPTSPVVTTTVTEGGSFKFGTFVWIVLALLIPLWPISLPLCLYLAYRSYKKPTQQTVRVISH